MIRYTLKEQLLKVKAENAILRADVAAWQRLAGQYEIELEAYVGVQLPGEISQEEIFHGHS